MTIEDARNLIYAANDKISKILTDLVDEVGVVPKSIVCSLERLPYQAPEETCRHEMRAAIKGMEL